MIKAGENINITDNNGCTAAIKAAIYGRVKYLNKLIKARADVGIADEVGQTAVTHAEKRLLQSSRKASKCWSRCKCQRHMPQDLQVAF